jgi:hypothetical protein
VIARRKTRGRESQIAFEAISIEGGLLSPEWLAKVAQLAAGMQSESDYRIPKGLNLRDEIGRYWRIAQAHWGDFNAGRNAKADPKELAEHFVTSLLRETFGFLSLVDVPPVVISERSYPIGRAALAGRVPVVVAPAESGLDALSAAFGDSGRRRSAFGLAQEYLNAQDGALWGIASDGSVLRILRDNASLTRPAWIESDLARIFTEERYADFAVLWLLLHETRFGRGGQPATECALETWRNAGREEGTRAREHLRRGVEEALVALGHGFLAHPENQALRTSLQNGTLSKKDYFNQLLRLVYRLIFLLTVEERGLLHPDGTNNAVKALYAQGYALRRLRERAVKRNAHDRFSDLWEATKIVFRGVDKGEPRLGLPALAGIFAAIQCAALDAARLENRSLFLAVFKLAWLRENGSLARVNWRDMGPEELGSVYESLLELMPQITQDGRQFSFAAGGETKGNARKTTGSYYTPDSLVQVLLDSALEPVIAETIAKNPDKPVDALLALSIVDPACGSGHFLLAAARRLAAHVARLQASGTPSAAEYRHALRQVVGRCIYGVDLNPMAVELCKVSLWMEAVEPGLPLTFLNSHIQHGNALLGTTPELMANGIPDAAWEPIEGDDKKTAAALKKRNKAEAAGQRRLDFNLSSITDAESEVVARAVVELDAASDANPDALAKKESQWDRILGSAEYQHQKFVADAWCAAFVWPKQPGELAETAPTNELWRQMREGKSRTSAVTINTVGELAEQYRFFHWYLQFPQVFANGGFDVILGNPPWERVKLQEQEFFASRSDEIAGATNAAARKKLIEKLPEVNSQLWTEWAIASRRAEGESHSIRQSGRYPLCGKGDVNTYAIFAEHNRTVLGSRGRAGFIVPPGLATDDTTKAYFQDLIAKNGLIALFEFENEEFLFPGIDHRVRFIVITVARERRSGPAADIAFANRSVEALSDASRHFSLSPSDFETLNPNTRTCPTFRSRRDAEINLAIYRRGGILWRESDEANGNPWRVRFMAMFHMANDSGLFKTRAELEAEGYRLEGNHFIGNEGEFLPLIEAKMLHYFDHRFGTYEGQSEAQENQGKLPELDLAAHSDASRVTQPNYWVASEEVKERVGSFSKHEWLLAWRRICRSTDQRTLIASLFPLVGVGDSEFLLLSGVDAVSQACLYGNLCAFAFDYASRQKIGGTNASFHIIRQLPVLSPKTYECNAPWSPRCSVADWLLPRILELTYTAWDLELFARDVGHDGPPLRWDADRRFLLRCELDAAFFHLYRLSRDDADYVMDTFPIVRKNDEKAHGEYRSKRVILEIYDAMTDAARTGVPYRTRLDPPPADTRVAHERRVPEIPAIPSIIPSMMPEDEATIVILALLRAQGGTMRRTDLARAFALRARPDLLVQLAPPALSQTAQGWAHKVGQRVIAPGLLATKLRELSARSGVKLMTDASSRSVVIVSPSAPPDSDIAPWFRFEARLALHVLRSQTELSLGTIDALIIGDDRALLVEVV